MRVVNVVLRDAILMAALSALPSVPMIVETSLFIQVASAAIAPPVDVGKSIGHPIFPLLVRCFAILRCGVGPFAAMPLWLSSLTLATREHGVFASPSRHRSCALFQLPTIGHEREVTAICS